MFIETHALSNKEGSPNLTFVKSLNVQAFPCGRRRSIDLKDSEGNDYYIPFDPEARLNTEVNNRKAVSLNGFSNTYIGKHDSNALTLFLAGYSFNIKIDDNYSTLNAVFNGIAEALAQNPVDTIYANIRISQTPLYEGFDTYYETSVLSAQPAIDVVPGTCLDLVKTFAGSTPADFKAENFYFSGLSFSAIPVAEYELSNSADSDITAKRVETGVAHIVTELYSDQLLTQQVVSLCIAKKVGNVWYINQEALLPKVTHGDKEDSVSITNLQVTSLDTKTLKQDGNNVPIIKVVNNQLQIVNVIRE